MRAVSCILACMLLLVLTGCNDNNSSTASSALIGAFQNSCQSAGAWTQQALANTQSLINTIQSIQSNDACKPYVATLAGMANAGAQIQQLLTNTNYANYRQQQEDVQDLTLALASAPAGSPLATQLSQQLVTAQVALVNADAANQASTDVSSANQFANSALAFSNYTQSIVNNTGGIQQCLKQSPEVAIELATNLLALGGSFVSPVYGAAATLVGGLINMGVEAARNSGSNDALWSLYQTEMPTALGCGLESMTELYCDASDAFDLLQLQADPNGTKASGQGSDPTSDPIWQELNLEGTQLPVLSAWLSQVRNGTLPSDPTEAQKQNAVWANLEALDSYNRTVQGELNSDEVNYNSAAGNPTTQMNILVNAIYNVANDLSTQVSSTQSNPFSELNGTLDQIACWLVLGYTTPSGQITTCPADSQTVKNQQYISTILLKSTVPTLEEISANFTAIYNQVQAQVQTEFANTITNDPMPLLAAAQEANPGSVSPLHALQSTLDFLNQDLQSNTGGPNPNLTFEIQQTIDVVQKSMTIINTPLGGLAPTAATAELAQLFQIFQLEPGVQFLGNRVVQLVQWDLSARLDKGEFPTDIGEILKVAGGDIANSLQEANVNSSFQVLSQDLNNSQAIMTSNISTFRSYFEPALENSVKYLAQQAKATGEPTTGPHRPFGQTLGHLCTLLLASGQTWPASVSWQICSQASLDSINPDPTGALTIYLSQLQQGLQGQGDPVRFCAYHRFLRANRLAQIKNSLGENQGDPDLRMLFNVESGATPEALLNLYSQN